MSGMRTPPNDVEAEQNVLGALLVDNAAWDRVADLLTAEDFYEPLHRSIFSAIGGLVMASKPADAYTVRERGNFEREYLEALSVSVPSAAHVRRYAEVVRERSIRREVMRIGGELADDALHGHQGKATVHEAIDKAITRLLGLQSVGSADHEPKLVGELLPGFVDHLNALHEQDEGSDALATGLGGLDDLLAGGMRAGDLIVLGARPSMGKTSFVLTVCRSVARRAPVLMCTLEDMLLGQTRRLVAAEGSINLADLRNPKRAPDPDRMWSALTHAVQDLSGLELYLDDQAGLSVMDVRRKVQQVRRRAGGRLGLVIVDYLQLMEGEGENRNQALGYVANQLRRAAKEFAVPIILLSQLSRKADERAGPPQMSDLRDSGDIESAARIVALLYRKHVQNHRADKNHAELHVVKQNDGPTGVVHLFFDGPRLRFADWDTRVHGPIPSDYGPAATSSRSKHEGLSA